jgi:hypothetical protein
MATRINGNEILIAEKIKYGKKTAEKIKHMD